MKPPNILAETESKEIVMPGGVRNEKKEMQDCSDITVRPYKKPFQDTSCVWSAYRVRPSQIAAEVSIKNAEMMHARSSR